VGAESTGSPTWRAIPWAKLAEMPGWVIWIIAACVLAVGEMLTLGFFLAPFAVGAALAGLADALGASTAVDFAVFLVVSSLLLLLVRPIARAHRRLPPATRTGTAALVGRRAIVLERIANDEGVGCVKIDGGEVWTARSYDEHEVIDAGERVEVVEIRGATALVMH
jgi:membrane protein implicated in regulation of membrane protease activity